MLLLKKTTERSFSVSDDTDVFVLLLHYYQAQNLSIPVVMESPIKDRAVIDTR